MDKMAISAPKKWVKHLEKISIFRFFEHLVLMSRKAFVYSRISQNTFSQPILPKKRMEKWPFLDLNYGLNPLKKSQIFDFLNFLFFCQGRRFFVLEYRKTHFPSLYCGKEKHGKMAISKPKQWVNPFGKISIFRLFDLLVFTAKKAVFSFQNIVQHIAWPILPKKKRIQKWQFLDLNHGLTPLRKSQFFDFFGFLFLQLRKEFFRSSIS